MEKKQNRTFVFYLNDFKLPLTPGMVVHASNPRTRQSQVDLLRSESQLGLHSEF